MSTRGWLVAIGLMAAGLGRLGAADAPHEVVDRGAGGRTGVNWTKGMITAKGLAPPQERAAPANQLALQRRVAIVDAVRLALEAIGGIHVTSESTVALYQLISDDVRTKVEGLLRGYRIVHEGSLGETPNYEVVIEIPLMPQPGQPNSLSSVVMPQVRELEPKAIELRARPTVPGGARPAVKAPPLDVPTLLPSKSPPSPTVPRRPGPYTGLIIDATGFKLQRCMCPKIYRRDGVEVWGTVEVSSEFVQQTGIAGFVPSLAAALDPLLDARVGDNPLVVQAIGRQGSVWANAVVSDDDAALILAENAKTQFLAKFQVTFVVDE